MIHQGACDKTLAALKANYDHAAFDYNVALKNQNTIMECHNSKAPTDDDDSGVFFMFPHQSHEMHSEAGRFAMARMAKMAMQRKMGRHGYHWHTPHRQHYA